MTREELKGQGRENIAQARLSKLIRSKSPSLALSHGKPVSLLVPYEDMLDLMKSLNELKDKKLLGEIARGRRSMLWGKRSRPIDY